MNKIYLILLIALCGCQAKRNVLSIEIYSVEADIETPYRIKCSDFHKSFQNEISKRKISEAIAIESLVSILNSLNKKEDCSVDTRALLLLKYKDFTDTICANDYCLTYRNRSFGMPDKLKNIIWDSAK